MRTRRKGRWLLKQPRLGARMCQGTFFFQGEKKMNKVRQLLEESLTGGLYQMTLSGATGEATGCSKKKIRPVLLKDRLLFQITTYRGTQVFHENHTAEEAAAILEADLSSSFKQLQIETTSFEATVLVSKKGKMTVRKKQRSVSEDNVKVSLSHNRKKRYILEEGRPVPFLVDLGVQTKEGKVITSRYDKFRQINRFLEFIEDIWPLLPKDRPVHIIDFGCGKSYLTFAMYYYLHELKGLTLEVTGLDLKKDVIVHCNELAKKYHYEGLSFLHGDIADYTGTSVCSGRRTSARCCRPIWGASPPTGSPWTGKRWASATGRKPTAPIRIPAGGSFPGTKTTPIWTIRTTARSLPSTPLQTTTRISSPYWTARRGRRFFGIRRPAISYWMPSGWKNSLIEKPPQLLLKAWLRGFLFRSLPGSR